MKSDTQTQAKGRQTSERKKGRDKETAYYKYKGNTLDKGKERSDNKDGQGKDSLLVDEMVKGKYEGIHELLLFKI